MTTEKPQADTPSPGRALGGQRTGKKRQSDGTKALGSCGDGDWLVPADRWLDPGTCGAEGQAED
jgi:hypothetical protein